MSTPLDRYHQRYFGFTLLELSVVLLIIGLLLSGLLVPVSTLLEQKKRSQMMGQFSNIEDALIGFAMLETPYHRLPCPDCLDTSARCTQDDVKDGIEDVFNNPSGTAKNNVCKVGQESDPYFSGGLPWVSLGLSSPTDPWGRSLYYQVVGDTSDKNGPNIAESDTCGDGVKAFGLCTIRDDSIIKINSACGDDVSSAIAKSVAVVHSQGEKASPSPLSCHEAENLDNDNIFVWRTFNNKDTNNYYDDMIFWLSPYILTARMVNAGVLP